VLNEVLSSSLLDVERSQNIKNPTAHIARLDFWMHEGILRDYTMRNSIFAMKEVP
jgi:hypothetical protein